MKILRAIGAFFAKIGRWIANTAWIQPLLIVGGIFAVIFSIPYIKTAIENAQIDNTDYDYLYYKDHSLDLNEGGKAEKLFSYLDAKDYENINKEFGTKFFFTFAQENCADCKSAVAAFKNFASNFKTWELDHEFKLYSILVDVKDDNDDKVYLAKKIVKENTQFLNELTTAYGEETTSTEYALYKNKESIKSTYTKNMKDLSDAMLETSSGLTTPMTFLYDYDKVQADANYHNANCITAVLFNTDALVEDNQPKNEVTKAQVLRDCWSYQTLFDPEYNK
ncbi:MAG: hypothetical protein J5955_04020 [Bacilli bacterium]|nr:hypothetical protein [Bacilli bacterium]